MFSFDQGLAFVLSLVGDLWSIAGTVETLEEVTDFGDGLNAAFHSERIVKARVSEECYGLDMTQSHKKGS